MLELNKIYNENCFETIKKINNNNIKIDIVLTSPPYNTSTGVNCKDQYHKRYNGQYKDIKTDEEYINDITHLFNEIDNILIENGVILFNISYSAAKPSLFLELLNNIILNTNFMVADTIIWKKKNSLPDNASPNRLSRITEFIFVICRKNELKTFKTNKQFLYEKNKHKFYKPRTNFIEAPNNDGSVNLNKATFSSILVEELLEFYAKENNLIYDPYIGTGTTAIGALRKKCNFIGSEIDKLQVEYAIQRIKKESF